MAYIHLSYCTVILPGLCSLPGYMFTEGRENDPITVPDTCLVFDNNLLYGLN